MPTEVQTRTGPRNPWLLPLILGLIIIAVILAFVFGSRIKSALSPTATPVQPTPTAKTVLVTATPAPGAPTATPGVVPPSATPAGGKGASTPLPHTTPVPTVPGLTLGMITRPLHRVYDVQHGADTKNPAYLYYLNPRQVVQNDLPHYGFTQGFAFLSPPPSPTPTPHMGADGRPVISFLISYQSKEYTVKVAQPGRTGPTGIWVIVTILPGRQ